MRALALLLAPLLLLGCPLEGVDDDTPAPVPASTADVAIPAGDLDLAGTLHLPARAEDQTVPAVVLVHGSGPQGRDATLPGQLNMAFPEPIDLFRTIGERLQAEGIAVLRYDNRTCGPFNDLCDNDYPLPPDDVGVLYFMADAIAAARWLAEQDGVDPLRVVVVGHSQGGGLVPRMLLDAPELAAGISLAGNWRPIDAVLAYQLEFSEDLLDALDYPQAEIDALLADLRAVVDDLVALRAGTFAGTTIGGAPVAFWQTWMDVDDARPADVAALARPVLAVNGGMDWNIPPDPELRGWEEALAANGVEGNDAVELACLTHAFNCVEGQEVGTEVADALFDAIVPWLDGRGLRAAGR